MVPRAPGSQSGGIGSPACHRGSVEAGSTAPDTSVPAYRLPPVNVARNIERRLERLVEGLAGRVFRGPLHPVEMGARLVREADLALRQTRAGPVAPNVYVIHVNPADLGQSALPEGLAIELAAYVEQTAADRGWRLDGPAAVHLELDGGTPAGAIRCRTEVSPGLLPVWGFLSGSSNEFALRHNRVTVGRSLDGDLVIDNPRVSRVHALLWRESGAVWVADAGSANGTAVDGVLIDGPAMLAQGSVVSFASVAFTYRKA